MGGGARSISTPAFQELRVDDTEELSGLKTGAPLAIRRIATEAAITADAYTQVGVAVRTALLRRASEPSCAA